MLKPTVSVKCLFKLVQSFESCETIGSIKSFRFLDDIKRDNLLSRAIAIALINSFRFLGDIQTDNDDVNQPMMMDLTSQEINLNVPCVIRVDWFTMLLQSVVA